MHKIYFYPHEYLRDRQLDTIKNFKLIFGQNYKLLNSSILENRRGGQVSKKNALSENKMSKSWKNIFPLINIKKRPKKAPKDSVIYIWGGLSLTGKFIVEVDNPWTLVGNNLNSMKIFKWVIKKILLSKRCIEIRTISEASRNSLGQLFGKEVFLKATCNYPFIQKKSNNLEKGKSNKPVRFLFVGTQFEIKGGETLIKSFLSVLKKNKNCKLDIITFLPNRFKKLVQNKKEISVHEASFSREEIHSKFMKHCDVLLFPTYGESFGMVALEALAHSMAIITTDVYALREMVINDKNGFIIKPPISIWNNQMPSENFSLIPNYKFYIRKIDTKDFEKKLEKSILYYIDNPIELIMAIRFSKNLFEKKFMYKG